MKYHRPRYVSAALAAYNKAKGYVAKDEADARDLITDILLAMKAQGKDVVAELRMAAGNAATTSPGLVTEAQKTGISAALEYAYNDQDTYLRVGSPTIDYGADWPDARERKATEYRAMGAAARLLGESHTAEQFDRLAGIVEAIES